METTEYIIEVVCRTNDTRFGYYLADDEQLVPTPELALRYTDINHAFKDAELCMLQWPVNDEQAFPEGANFQVILFNS